MILLTHNMLASPMKEAARQLPLGDFLNHDARPPAECSPEWQRHGPFHQRPGAPLALFASHLVRAHINVAGHVKDHCVCRHAPCAGLVPDAQRKYICLRAFIGQTAQWQA